MKTRNSVTKALAIATALAVLITVCAVWGARPAQAIIIINNKTGLFGIAAGQTVRITTLNAARASGIVSCAKVLDINGNVVAEHEMGTPIPLNQGRYFDWNASWLDLRPGQRAQIRVEVELEPAPDASGRDIRVEPGDAILTVEVFDTDTGKTMFTMPFISEPHHE